MNMTKQELYRIWNYKTIETLGLKNKYITFYYMYPICSGDSVKFELDIRNIYNKYRLYKVCDNIIDIKRSIKQFVEIQESIEKDGKIQ